MKAKELSYVLFLFLVGFYSCSKFDDVNDDYNPPDPRPSVRTPTMLYLQIEDKENGSSLFFADHPKYEVDQFTSFFKLEDKWKKFPFLADSIRKVILIPSIEDTVYVKIADLPQDTLVFRYGRWSSGIKPYLDDLWLNGKFYPARADKDSILTLRK